MSLAENIKKGLGAIYRNYKLWSLTLVTILVLQYAGVISLATIFPSLGYIALSAGLGMAYPG